MYCSKCGKSIDDNSAFCPNCGNPVKSESMSNDFNDFFAEDTADVSNDVGSISEPQTVYNSNTDIADNKVMAVLSYFGLLVLIPIFGAKDSKYAQYHASQGLTLSLCSLAYSFCSWLITFLLGLIFKPSYNYFFGYIPNPIISIISIVLGLGSIFFFVLAIMGIVNAASGKYKMLPLVGKIDILRKCK